MALAACDRQRMLETWLWLRLLGCLCPVPAQKLSFPIDDKESRRHRVQGLFKYIQGLDGFWLGFAWL